MNKTLIFGSPKTTRKAKKHHLNISDGNLSCNDESDTSTKLVRRARSFKNDLFGKINVLKAVNNASFRLNRKWGRSRIHSESELKHDHRDHEDNQSFSDIENISKQLQIALKHFQVAAKTKTEMLPGNGTVILDILIGLKLLIASKIGADKSTSLKTAKTFLYQTTCDLIKVCDQIILESSNEYFQLNQESVSDASCQLTNAFENLINIINYKLSNLSTKQTETEYCRQQKNYQNFKESSFDTPLTRDELDLFEKSNNLINYENQLFFTDLNNENLYHNYELKDLQTPFLPPKKQRTFDRLTLPDQFDRLSVSSKNESFYSESVDSLDSILSDYEPEYKQFENVNSNETLSSSAIWHSPSNATSNSESGIVSLNSISMSSMFSTNKHNFAIRKFAFGNHNTISQNRSTSFYYLDYDQSLTDNPRNLSPILLPAHSLGKHQNDTSNENLQETYESIEVCEKKPPLPLKKKHMFQSVAYSVMVYMEMIGNCSTSLTCESGFAETQSSLPKLQINRVVDDADEELPPPALPPKKNQHLALKKPDSVTVLPPLPPKTVKQQSTTIKNQKCPNLCDLEQMDFDDTILTKYLLKNDQSENLNCGAQIKGGYLQSLIFLATKVKNEDYSYQRAFLTTYRTFVSPLELIKMLIEHYRDIVDCQLEREGRSKDLLALLSKLINDLICIDLDNEMLTTVMEFAQTLITNGELVAAKLLRISLIDKFNQKEKFHYESSLPPSVHLSNENICCSLLDLKSEQLAEQMTLMDADLFAKVEIPEVLIWAQEQSEERSPNLTKFTEHFNKMSYWVRSRILEQNEAKDRERYVTKFIKIMKHLRKINNYNSYLAILSALDSAPVRRLGWQKQITDGLKEYCALIDSSSSFRAYRQALAETQPPCIPYIGLVLQDLTFIHTGNSEYLPNGMINFSKRWQQFHVVENFQKFKFKLYNFKRNERITLFFNNFENFMCEEAMWHISESIKPPRVTRKPPAPPTSSPATTIITETK